MRFAGCCNISCKRIDAVEHSDDLGASRKGQLQTSMTHDDGNISYTVEGPMELRGSKGKLLEGDQAKSLTLRVTYLHVPGAPTQADILRDNPMTALEQLQLNSLETNLRLGHPPSQGTRTLFPSLSLTTIT